MFALLLEIELPYEPSCLWVGWSIGLSVGRSVGRFVGWSLGRLVAWLVRRSVIISKKGRETLVSLCRYLEHILAGNILKFCPKATNIEKTMSCLFSILLSYFGENKSLMDIQYIQYIYMPWEWAKELMGIKKVIFLTNRENEICWDATFLKNIWYFGWI